MGPKAALSAGIRKTLDGSGRSTRSEFWWFAPLSLALPVAFATQVDWTKIEVWGIWKLLFVMFLAIPFLNAASRRLHDTGLDGHEALYPFMPFIILWTGYQLIYWGGWLLGWAGGFGMMITLVLWFFALLILAPLHLFAFFFSIWATASVIGHLICPSDRGANRYGPNPVSLSTNNNRHEVNDATNSYRSVTGKQI